MDDDDEDEDDIGASFRDGESVCSVQFGAACGGGDAKYCIGQLGYVDDTLFHLEDAVSFMARVRHRLGTGGGKLSRMESSSCTIITYISRRMTSKQAMRCQICFVANARFEWGLDWNQCSQVTGCMSLSKEVGCRFRR